MRTLSFSTFVLFCAALAVSADAGASVNVAAFNPTGDLLAAGTDVEALPSEHRPNRGGLYLLSAKSGQVLHHLRPAGAVRGVAFSPDGRFVMAAGGRYESLGEFNIWDSRTGKLRLHIESEMGEMYSSMALSADGRLAACGSYSHVDLYEIPSGRLRRLLRGRSGETYESVIFTPNATSLWGVSIEGTVWKWDVATGALARPVSAPGDIYGSMSYLKNGLLVEAKKGIIQLRDQNLVAQTPAIKYASISPRTLAVGTNGGRVATSLIIRSPNQAPRAQDMNSSIGVWSLGTRQLLQQWSGHSGRINAVAFSSNSSLVSGGTDHRVKLWTQS
jgi:WD40 repeat protein